VSQDPLELSYCVVNTGGREYLMACLDAIARTHPAGVSHELLVLDNASEDGSVEAVRERHPEARLIALERRSGKGENDSRLLQEARGRFCLLLNEDSELQEGASRALVEALAADPRAAAAGAQLLDSAGEPVACAWRLPDVPWALAAAVFMHDRVAVQSRGQTVREVGWVQSSAMLVRRDAAEDVGWLDPDFFVYSDETDFCKRLRDAGWEILFVPAAHAVHHDQLTTDAAAMRRRIVEFHRNRDLYFRKHGLTLTRLAWNACWTWAYLARAAAALVLPGRDARRYLLHARQQLRPGDGEGVREAAQEYNRRLAKESGAEAAAQPFGRLP
jgi:N-acetylglucosaminyl-diphospho-decaprenol L-rhamnosyltransferase